MPAANTITPITASSDTAVPKSGSSRISPISTPTITPIGSSEYPSSLMRCRRRSRISAVNMIAASLASSDGWMPKPPMPNQRRVPLIGLAEQHARSSMQPTTPSRTQISAIVAIGAVVDAHHDRQHRHAHRGPHQLAGDEEIGLLKALQRHQRRGAVDHDHAGANQRQRRQEQPLVRLQLPCHTPRPAIGRAKRTALKFERSFTRYMGRSSQ